MSTPEDEHNRQMTSAILGVKTYGPGGETAASRTGSAMRESHQATPATPKPTTGGGAVLILIGLGALFLLGLNGLEAFREGMKIEAVRRSWFPLGHGGVLVFLVLWPILTCLLIGTSFGVLSKNSDRVSASLRALSLAIIAFEGYLVTSLFLIAYAPLYSTSSINWGSLWGVLFTPFVAALLMWLIHRIVVSGTGGGGMLKLTRRRRITMSIPALALVGLSVFFSVNTWRQLQGNLASMERFGWEALRPDETYAMIMINGMPTLITAFLAATIFYLRKQ